MNAYLDRLTKLLFERQLTNNKEFYLYFICIELLVGVLVLHHAWSWAPYIARISDVVLPLGLAQYLDISLMFNNVLPYLNALILTAAILAGFFRLNKYAYLVAVFSMHLQYISRYSLGEISHGSNMAGLCLIALAAAALAYKNGPEYRKLAFGLMLFFIGLAYTSAAICKLIGTGPTWIDGRHLWLWIGERSVDVMAGDGVFELNMLQQFVLQWHGLSTIILLFGLLTELIGVLIWSPRLRPYVVLLIIGMHYGIEWTMNISFSSYVYILILVGFPWHKFIGYGLNKLNHPSQYGYLDQLLTKGDAEAAAETAPATTAN